ncbi:unnamed protein product [Meganyctiphanes norvegica]|uniref:Uncharacterized protein n=1 Tax=Meganyctiphanes norvegica TaxID=48144 RepID=A0AAV2QAW3_MEGNR
MQKRFLSMVDQIVSSNFVDKLENSSINNDTKISSNNGISDVRSSMWVETDVKVNPADYQPDTKTLGKELKINTIEASPKNVDGQPLFSASTRPKAGFYKEIDYEFSSLEKDKNANLGIKDNSEVENFSKDENKTVNIIKTPEGKSTKASIKTKSKKGRGRPRKVKK